MTAKDYEVYNYIVDYVQKNGYAPSIREIANDVGKAPSIIKGRLWNLEKGGLIKTKEMVPRAIKLVGYKFVKE